MEAGLAGGQNGQDDKRCLTATRRLLQHMPGTFLLWGSLGRARGRRRQRSHRACLPDPAGALRPACPPEASAGQGTTDWRHCRAISDRERRTHGKAGLTFLSAACIHTLIPVWVTTTSQPLVTFLLPFAQEP